MNAALILAAMCALFVVSVGVYVVMDTVRHGRNATRRTLAGTLERRGK